MTIVCHLHWQFCNVMWNVTGNRTAGHLVRCPHIPIPDWALYQTILILDKRIVSPVLSRAGHALFFGSSRLRFRAPSGTLSSSFFGP
jgi:hypothetical protein